MNESIGEGKLFSDENLAHKQTMLNSILKILDKQKNHATKGTGVQSDLDSLSDAAEENERIEKIVNQKSKSIADVLLNEGLG